jgi:tRNA modification GTPase
MNGNLNQDTICALATANGIGALGIIRLSGKEAVEIAQKCFKGSDLRTAKSHSVHYGFVVENRREILDIRHETADNREEIIDEKQDLKSEDEQTKNQTPETKNQD